jgi:hypothetical protein
MTGHMNPDNGHIHDSRSMGLFDTSSACSRRCQNSTFGLKQLAALIFRFAAMYEQKAP